MLRRSLILLVLVLAAPAAAANGPEFVTPSGNIGCELWKLDTGATVGMLCQMRHNRRTFLLPRNARPYELKGQFPPAITYRTVLQYGQMIEHGRFFCRSFSVQLVCGNRVTGHGFSLSREKVKLW